MEQPTEWRRRYLLARPPGVASTRGEDILGASFLRLGGEPPERWLLQRLRFQWRRRSSVSLADLPARGTAAVVLEVPGTDFQLLAAEEQSRLLAEWGRILAGRAGEDPVLRRLQLLQVAALEPNDAELDYLGRHADRSSPFYGPYSAARKEEAARLSRRSYLVLQTSAASAPALEAEAASVADAMSAGFGEVLPLSPASLGELVAASLNGEDASELDDLRLEEQADLVAGNRSLQRTFMISGWPATVVDQGFLLPLLLDLRGPYVLSLHLDPVRRAEAVRSAGARETSHLSDLGLRERGGFLDTAGRRRRRQEAARQSEELAAGAGLFSISGWLRISTATAEELEVASRQALALARRCQLRLAPCRHRQVEGLLATLPPLVAAP